MIRCEKLAKIYPGPVAALVDVDLTIPAGQFLLVCGHSGAGKTTLFRLIAGLETPTSGTVSVNEHDVARLGRGGLPYYRRRFGLVLSDAPLLPQRTVAENVALPLLLAGVPRRQAFERVALALERVGLAGRAHELPPTLSGGEQQRVAIARAVVHRPSVVIADEPTAQLDHDSATEVVRLLRAFHAAGVTMIIATHDEALFSSVAQRRIVLAHGRLVEDAR